MSHGRNVKLFLFVAGMGKRLPKLWMSFEEGEGMSKETQRVCPNCKTEIRVVFSEGRFDAEVKRCPGCGLMVLLGPEGCVLETAARLSPLAHQSVWRARGKSGDHSGCSGRILPFRPGDRFEPPQKA